MRVKSIVSTQCKFCFNYFVQTKNTIFAETYGSHKSVISSMLKLKYFDQFFLQIWNYISELSIKFYLIRSLFVILA